MDPRIGDDHPNQSPHPNQPPHPTAETTLPRQPHRRKPTPERVRVVPVDDIPVTDPSGNYAAFGSGESVSTLLTRQAMDALLDDKLPDAIDAMRKLSLIRPTDGWVHACLVRLVQRAVAP